MDPRWFGEFMGTLVLVLIGNGVVANVVLKKTLGSAAGWLILVWATCGAPGVLGRVRNAANRLPSRAVSSMSELSRAPPAIGAMGGRLSWSKHTVGPPGRVDRG